MRSIFKSLTLLLLVTLLLGCGTPPTFPAETTSSISQITLPPLWVTPTNQFLTEDRTRFRMIGDTLYWDVQDPTDPSNSAKWIRNEIPIREIIDNEDFVCPVRSRPLRMGYMDREKQILYLAFDRPVRYADETHPDGFYIAHFLYRSEDGGRTWTPMTSPTMSETRDSLSEIRFHPSGSGYLSVWRYPGDGPNEIFITEDGGQSWSIPEPLHLPSVYFSASIMDKTCTLDEDGTIRLTYEVKIYYGHQTGSLTYLLVYEKVPGEGVWTFLSEMPPIPVYPDGK